MKKVGLCVRYDCNNYGSMLQIFATQKAVLKAGWKYELIRYDKKTIGFIIKNLSRLFNPYFMNGKIEDFKRKRIMKSYPEIQKQNNERLKMFNEYRKKNIGPYSPVFKGYGKLQTGAENYDAMMVGSDQLWTPAGIKSRFYNLLFVPSEIRKISFATSFGVAEVPKSQVKLTKEYLNRIDYLSVRETSGKKLIKKLTGKDATVAVDPTLLFSGEEWEEFFPTQQIIDEPYIFAYFLGATPEHRESVSKIADKYGLKIVTCPHMDEFVQADLGFGDYQSFKVGPVEFLNLIRGAKYICTDSFHGSVFSILNHKKFITFNRYTEELLKSKNGRIDSLFELLNIQDRHCIDDYDNVVEVIDQNIDYSSVEKALSIMRQESFEFLFNALK